MSLIQIQPVVAGSNAGMAGAFLRMGLGARALAMGDVGVALPGHGYGFYYNPATLPFLEKRTLLTSFSYLSLDRRFNFLGVAMPLTPPVEIETEALRAGLGVGWINAGPGDIEGRDVDGNPIGNFNYAENAFYFSFALQISEQMAIGVSPVILHANFPHLVEGEKFSSTRLGFDAGVLVLPVERLTLGVQARHVNAQYRWDTNIVWGEDGTTVVDKFPRIYRFGAAYDFPFGLLLTGEFETSDQQDNQVHFGGEYTLANFDPYVFQLRAGYDDHDYALGLGFGFTAWGLQGQLEYAYQIQKVAPFDSQVISLSVGF